MKVEKWQDQIFEKKSWFRDIREKVSKLAQNQRLIFFSKTAVTIFFGFWPEVSTKYGLQFELNLFFRKICNFEIFGIEIVKKLSKLRLLAISIISFPYFAHNDRRAWCLVVFLTICRSSQCILVNYCFEMLFFMAVWNIVKKFSLSQK